MSRESEKVGEPLLSEAAMLAEEEKFLWPDGKPAFRAGLALSGGGIRAATVSLGVLQVLAERGLLAGFQYLSTVSGGGYIGSSLSWFWCEKRVEAESRRSQAAPPVRFGAEPGNFPFQDETWPPVAKRSPLDLRQRAAENLKFLRSHGSYLTSGDGVRFAALIIAVVRTILLSLAVWLPLLVFLFGVFEVVDDIRRGGLAFDECVSAASTSPAALNAFKCRPSFGVLLIAASAFVLVFYSGIILFSFLSRIQRDSSGGGMPHARYPLIAFWLVVSVGTFALPFWTVSSLDSIQPPMGVQITLVPLVGLGFLMLAIAEWYSPGNRDYFLRRGFEKYSGIVLPNVVVALFISLLPLIVSSLKPPTGGLSLLGPLGGAVTLVSGAATALYGYYLKAKSILPGLVGQIFAMAGALLFLSGLLLCSFILAHEIFEATSGGALGKYIAWAFLFLVVVALAIGCFGSINATGLHRFYRDRLMETFMPMAYAVEKGSARESDVADNLSMADVVRGASERGNRPYHLVNAHAILVNDTVDPKVALRGGDNFLISPAFVGSSATGWIRTTDYVRRHGALTLASAMAVSGAAANANAGYIGAGVTRDRFVSAVMSLLNIRLGLWVGNPKITAKSARPSAAGKSRRLRTRVATYFWPVLTAGIFGFGHDRESTFLELSDGGHFENLGLYELIRRKLDLILVVDAEQDSGISLSALVSSANRIKEDFGVSIRFLDSKGPELLLGKDSNRYPSGARLATSPFVVAQICYPGVDRCGVLIYIKSTMMAGLEFVTEGYKAANPDFPHQTTVNQFFNPDQFEAYRDLGKKSCAMAIDALDLTANFMRSSALLERYGFPSAHAGTTISLAEADHKT